MNAFTPAPRPDAADAHLSASTPADPASRLPVPARAGGICNRFDGWTPERQRLFLESLAEGHSVVDACRIVGLSHQSAYALRRRAAGAAFAIGWTAARIVAREKLADTLMVRAIEGQRETVRRDDGVTIERHRFDNRLATLMLARLDRMAQNQADDPVSTAAYHVAQSFDAFLDTLPGQCAAAGDGSVRYPQLPQLCPVDRFDPQDPFFDPETVEESPPVWFDDDNACWYTDFPPPPGFDGTENGDFGDDEYSRTLTPDELAIVESAAAARLDERRAEQSVARDRWFAAEALEAAPPPAARPRRSS